MTTNQSLIAFIDTLRQSLPAPLEHRRQVVATLDAMIKAADEDCLRELRAISERHEARCDDAIVELLKLANRFQLQTPHGRLPIEMRVGRGPVPALGPFEGVQ